MKVKRNTLLPYTKKGKNPNIIYLHDLEPDISETTNITEGQAWPGNEPEKKGRKYAQRQYSVNYH